MKNLANIKILSCGEIPNRIIENIAQHKIEKDNYINIKNGSFFKYYIKSFIKEESLVKNLTIYKKHDKKNIEELDEVFKDLDIAIIIGDLKDENSFRNMRSIAKTARKKGILLIGVVLVPTFQDKTEQIRLKKEIHGLIRVMDTVIPLELEKIAASIKAPLIDEKGVEFYESYPLFCIQQLIKFFEANGAIRINKKDLYNVFSEGGLGYISMGYGMGQEKLETAIDSIFIPNPELTTYAKFLVSICVPEDMKISYIDEVLNKINEKLECNVSVTFKATLEKDRKDDLFISVIGIK